MKSCPRCGKSYPDDERFCETDGSALIAAGGAGGRGTTIMPDDAAGAGGATICPECHGKAEPGETICNFCGTQLNPEAAAPPAGAARAQPTPSQPARTAVTPEDYVPAHGRLSTGEMGGEPPYDETPEEEAPLRERITRILGYAIAAIVAVVAGGWFALHVSRSGGNAPVATASPAASVSPAPAASAPMVAIASNMQITVKGADLAAALNRDQASARKVFDDNRDAVLDIYKRALEGDSTLHDGMVVRLHVLPDGSVSGGTVVVSTSPNPSLDAEVVAGISGWKYAAASGAPVDVDYPLIFATSGAEAGGIEADLSSKYASLGPNETPEYASAPSAMPSPPAAAAASPEAAVTPPPVVAALPPPAAPAVKPPRHRHRVTAPPPPSIGMRVNEALSADKRLRRVQAYATDGGMVTLTGRVFDDKTKAAAERTVRGVSGVTGVIDNLTTDTSVWARNEVLINQQLQAAGLTGVTAKVIGNGAYLDGTVKTNLDRQRAETVAVSAAPVKIRTNLIRVDPGFFGF